jgi:ribosomal protein L37AE/L43A
MIAIYQCPYCKAVTETDRPGVEFQTCRRCHRVFADEPKLFGWTDADIEGIKAAGAAAGKKLDTMIIRTLKEKAYE